MTHDKLSFLSVFQVQSAASEHQIVQHRYAAHLSQYIFNPPTCFAFGVAGLVGWGVFLFFKASET